MLKSGGQAIVLVRLCVLLASPCVCCSRIALCACLAAAGRAVLALQSELHFASVRQSMNYAPRLATSTDVGAFSEAARPRAARGVCIAAATWIAASAHTRLSPAPPAPPPPPSAPTLHQLARLFAPCPALVERGGGARRRPSAAALQPNAVLCSVHAAMSGARVPVSPTSSRPAASTVSQVHLFTTDQKFCPPVTCPGQVAARRIVATFRLAMNL